MFINNDNVTLSNLMVITVTVRDAGLNVKYNTIMWGAGRDRREDGVREGEREHNHVGVEQREGRERRDTC